MAKFNARNIAGGFIGQYDSLEDLVADAGTEGVDVFRAGPDGDKDLSDEESAELRALLSEFLGLDGD